MVKESNRSTVGILALIAASVIFIINILFLIRPAWNTNIFSKDGIILYYDAFIIGIALTLTGVFNIFPAHAKKSIIGLGITSILFGILIGTDATFHLVIWWSPSFSGPMKGALGAASPFWLIGLSFLIKGIDIVAKA